MSKLAGDAGKTWRAVDLSLIPLDRLGVAMTRSRGSYLGGSTVHIPGRDSNGSETMPLKALERARLLDVEEEEMCARINDYLARYDRHMSTASLNEAKKFVEGLRPLDAEALSIDYSHISVRSPELKAAIFRLKYHLDLRRMFSGSHRAEGG